MNTVKKAYNSAYYIAHRAALMQQAAAYYRANRNKVLACVKRYRVANAREIAVRRRTHYVANSVEILGRAKVYYRDHQEKFLAWSRAYRSKHRAQDRAAARAWQKNNPDKRKDIVLRRRARKAGGDTRPCAVKIALLRLERFCRWCCTPLLPEIFTVDHVVPLARGGGHVPDNLAAVCGRCNSSKGKKLLSAWEWQLV